MIEKYFVNGEGEYVIPYLLMIPDKPNNKALIYLHPTSKVTIATEASEEGREHPIPAAIWTQDINNRKNEEWDQPQIISLFGMGWKITPSNL